MFLFFFPRLSQPPGCLKNLLFFPASCRVEGVPEICEIILPEFFFECLVQNREGTFLFLLLEKHAISVERLRSARRTACRAAG
jgi:hypothetical protein